jgi:hypothetical protein
MSAILTVTLTSDKRTTASLRKRAAIIPQITQIFTGDPPPGFEPGTNGLKV